MFPRSKIYERWYLVFEEILHDQWVHGQDPQAYKYIAMIR